MGESEDNDIADDPEKVERMAQRGQGREPRLNMEKGDFLSRKGRKETRNKGRCINM